jgi:MFS transporter, DHA1 family, multidrug resistance protein
MQYKINTTPPHILVFIIIISFASMTSGFISPSLPYIAKYFDISRSTAQNVVTYFVFGYIIGQIIYAPLIKGLGIKKTLNTGIAICFTGTVICYLSYVFDSFGIMKLGRIITGMGAGCGFVTIYSTINNIYYSQDARRITSYTSLSFVLVPGILMVVSGWIVTNIGWQHCFTFLSLWCYLIYLLGKTLPETAANAHISNIDIKKTLNNYRSVMSTKILVYALMYGIVASVFYIYVATASFVIIDDLKQTPEYFSLHHLIVLAGYLLGGLFSVKTHNSFSTKKSIKIGSLILASASFLLSIMHQYNYFNQPKVFFILFSLIYFSVPILFSNITIILLANSVEKFTVSAILGFLHLLPPLGFLRILSTAPTPGELIPLVMCMLSIMLLLLNSIQGLFRSK